MGGAGGGGYIQYDLGMVGTIFGVLGGCMVRVSAILASDGTVFCATSIHSAGTSTVAGVLP